jgi:hypothetical protein
VSGFYSERLAYAEFDLQLGVVRTNSHGPIEVQHIRPDRTIPDEQIVDEDSHLCSFHFGTQSVTVSRTPRVLLLD